MKGSNESSKTLVLIGLGCILVNREQIRDKLSQTGTPIRIAAQLAPGILKSDIEHFPVGGRRAVNRPAAQGFTGDSKCFSEPL